MYQRYSTGLRLQYSNNTENHHTKNLQNYSRRLDDDGHTTNTHIISRRTGTKMKLTKKTHDDYNIMSLQQRWCEYLACIAVTVCFLCSSYRSFFPYLGYVCWMLRSFAFLGIS